MGQKRLSVRKIREVLRLKWACGLQNRAVAASCRISPSSVSEYVQRARAAGLSWPLPEGLDDAGLEGQLYPPTKRPVKEAIPLPDWPAVHAELRKKGVTRQLVWQEYRAEHPQGYRYSQFCKLYHQWRCQLQPTMRQTHQAGTAMVDYAGLTMSVVDVATGELRQAQVFVHCLAASSYIYAEAQWSQDTPSWIGGHVRAHQDLGGVPPLTVPDYAPRDIFRVLCPARLCARLRPSAAILAVGGGPLLMPAT